MESFTIKENHISPAVSEILRYTRTHILILKDHILNKWRKIQTFILIFKIIYFINFLVALNNVVIYQHIAHLTTRKKFDFTQRTLLSTDTPPPPYIGQLGYIG